MPALVPYKHFIHSATALRCGALARPRRAGGMCVCVALWCSNCTLFFLIRKYLVCLPQLFSDMFRYEHDTDWSTGVDDRLLPCGASLMTTLTRVLNQRRGRRLLLGLSKWRKRSTPMKIMLVMMRSRFIFASGARQVEGALHGAPEPTIEVS